VVVEVEGRVALVTGASSGVGRAVALALADAGARLLAHGRDPDRTTDVARRTGGAPLLADLVVPGVADDLAAAALDVHGRVDLLVACAGAGWSGSFLDMPGTEAERLWQLNLLAPVQLVRAVLPGMLDAGTGHLVLMGSVAGRTGVAGETVYAATKAALDAFAESLRLELRGTGVGVTVVLPGAVRTPFFEHRGRGYDRRLPRPVPPERVADATVAAVRAGRAEAWVPRWLRVAPAVRALAPTAYRRLAGRYGEQVRVRNQELAP
jgi:short-subunit dehydrogenase